MLYAVYSFLDLKLSHTKISCVGGDGSFDAVSVGVPRLFDLCLSRHCMQFDNTHPLL